MSDVDDRSVDPDATADRVVLSYPADLSKRGQWRLGQEYYRTYLRKTLGRVAEGETREEFTDVGCCGSQVHVPLRIERVDGGDRVGPDTDVEYVEREACGVEGGWHVQNEIDD